jgi:hypothetical protein
MWKNYSSKLNNLLDHEKDLSLFANNSLPNNTSTLNRVWSQFNTIIIKAAKSTLPKQTTTNQRSTDFIYNHNNSYTFLNKLNKFYHSCYKQFNLQLHFNIINHNQFKKIINNLNKLKIPVQNIQTAYDNKSFPSFLSNIKDAIIALRIKIRLTDKIENDQRIKSFIQKRIDNFRDNPSAMINSCLERRKKTIILDHVLIKKDGQTDYLELDPTKVMEETSHHFQTIADSKNSTKDSHPFWHL